jgi:hypothetical protein
MEIKLTKIDKPGMLRKGDRLLLHASLTNELKSVKIKKVLFSGSRGEEVIYNKRKNYYFITKMLTSGDSWVTSAYRVDRGAPSE